MNESRTCANSDTPMARGRSGPVRYELIDRHGKRHGPFYRTDQVREYAELYFPGQEQDPDRIGKGWDVQVVGS